MAHDKKTCYYCRRVGLIKKVMVIPWRPIPNSLEHPTLKFENEFAFYFPQSGECCAELGESCPLRVAQSLIKLHFEFYIPILSISRNNIANERLAFRHGETLVLFIRLPYKRMPSAPCRVYMKYSPAVGEFGEDEQFIINAIREIPFFAMRQKIKPPDENPYRAKI